MIAYHYTGIDTLEKILANTSKENLRIRLRATHINFLNDGFENVIGRYILPKCIGQIEKELKVKPDSSLAPLVMNNDYMDNHIVPHLKSFNENNEGMSKFVISLSEDSDSLVMWSMYGNKGNGIAIGLDTDKLNPNSEQFFNVFKEKCNYWDDVALHSPSMRCNTQLYKKIREIYSGITDSRVQDSMKKLYEREVPPENMDFVLKENAVINLVSFCSVYNKLGMWSNEKEYRLSFDTLSFQMRYNKNRDGVYVPYVDIDFPLDALKEIVIGPTCGRNAMGMLRSLFYSRGLMNAIPMRYSVVPLQ